MTRQAPWLGDDAGRRSYPIGEPRWQSDDGAPLEVHGDLGLARSDIVVSDRSIWRYRGALPVAIGRPVSLGEGLTPLVEAHFRGFRALFKLEWMMPTGSFKDRGASVMISVLRQQGVSEIVEDSSGNGGAAIAAYGAAAGMTVHIIAPASTQPAKLAQIAACGARLRLVPGPRSASEEAAHECARTVFYASHNWHPFFIQGTKLLAYELWEDLGWSAPDAVVIPTGAGSNVFGCDAGFGELRRAGHIRRLPRLYAVQPANCAPVDAAFRSGAADHVPCEVSATIAEGTAIRRPVRMSRLLAALRRSRGGTVAVSEDDIARAAQELARAGLYAEPTAAMAAGGLARLRAAGEIRDGETVVVLLTGGGLKAGAWYERATGVATAGGPGRTDRGVPGQDE